MLVGDAIFFEGLRSGFAEGTPVADGDMFAVTVRDKSGGKYFLASFHGDTNGLATIPVVSATKAFYDTLDPEYKYAAPLRALGGACGCRRKNR